MGADAGQKFLTARGEAWAKSPMLALKSDRQRLGGPFAVEAMTQIPFQKLVTLAYNLHGGRAQTFAITGAGSISITFSLPPQGTSRSRYLHRIHHRTQKAQDVSLRSASFRLCLQPPPKQQPFQPAVSVTNTASLQCDSIEVTLYLPLGWCAGARVRT